MRRKEKQAQTVPLLGPTGQPTHPRRDLIDLVSLELGHCMLGAIQTGAGIDEVRFSFAGPNPRSYPRRLLAGNVGHSSADRRREHRERVVERPLRCGA